MRRAVIFGAAIAGALAAGWLTAARAPALAADERAADWAPPQHGGEVLGAVRERLAALGYAPQLAPTSDAALEAPPPPPDIAIMFRRDLTAIERRPEGLLVWIVDFTQPAGRRSLKPGDVYQDGWRVSAVSDQTIELRRRRETRSIAVFEAPEEP